MLKKESGKFPGGGLEARTANQYWNQIHEIYWGNAIQYNIQNL